MAIQKCRFGGADIFLDLFNKYIFASSDIEEDLTLLKIT